MSDKVKVCLIGCGRAGMIHARNYAGSVKEGPESFFDVDGREYRTEFYENDRFVRSEENN